MMTNNRKPFSGFAVKDLTITKIFFKKFFKLEIEEEKNHLYLNFDENHRVYVYPKLNHQAADYTILNFPVPDIEPAVMELRKKGLQFERYASEQLKTDIYGINHDTDPRIAWFKDPSGNIMSVIEMPDA